MGIREWSSRSARPPVPSSWSAQPVTTRPAPVLPERADQGLTGHAFANLSILPPAPIRPDPTLRAQRTGAEDGSGAAAPVISAWIVEDGASTAPGQMERRVFLAALTERIHSTADRALAPVGRGSTGCPYIVRLLARVSRMSAAALERLARVHASAAPGSAEEYLRAFGDRIERGVAAWIATGRIPENVPSEAELSPGTAEDAEVSDVAAAAGADRPGELRFARAETGGAPALPTPIGDRAALRAHLGPGAPLPAEARTSLEAGFGEDLGAVRVHHNARAGVLADQVAAHAVTIGDDVAFAPGAYRPESATGMALLAHEVVHTLQQRGADGPIVGFGEPAQEREADEGARAALAWAYAGDEKRPWWRPGGLRLQRCGKEEVAPPQEVPAVDPERVALVLAAKPMLEDSYCKTTATFDLVDKKGGTSQGKLPDGTLVQVTALQGTGYDIVVKSGAWAGKTGYLPNGALTEAQGVIGDQVFNEGRLGGTLDDTGTMINCLGHASGQKRAAYITNGTTEDMLKGLGFTCEVGDSTVLAPKIKAGKYAMMVYMYIYKPSWREAAEQGLSYAEVAKKYGWSTDSWRQPDVYFGPNGEDRPIDYHALDYNAKTKRWEWVANNRQRERAPDYDVDSDDTNPATLNPDDYFGSSGQVLVSIACYK